MGKMLTKPAVIENPSGIISAKLTEESGIEDSSSIEQARSSRDSSLHQLATQTGTRSGDRQSRGKGCSVLRRNKNMR
jgi:hypothetical protein